MSYVLRISGETPNKRPEIEIIQMAAQFHSISLSDARIHKFKRVAMEAFIRGQQEALAGKRVLKCTRHLRWFIAPRGRSDFDLCCIDLERDRKEMLRAGCSKSHVRSHLLLRILGSILGLYWTRISRFFNFAFVSRR